MFDISREKILRLVIRKYRPCSLPIKMGKMLPAWPTCQATRIPPPRGSKCLRAPQAVSHAVLRCFTSNGTWYEKKFWMIDGMKQGWHITYFDLFTVHPNDQFQTSMPNSWKDPRIYTEVPRSSAIPNHPPVDSHWPSKWYNDKNNNK